MAKFPPQPTNTITAKKFIRATSDKSVAERDELAAQMILRGNFPNFLRKMVPVEIEKNGNALVYRVTPQEISIGTDNDWVTWPLTGPSAQMVADHFGCVLPTPEISKQVWEHAKIKLTPKPLSGMTTKINGQTYSPKSFVASKHMISNEGIALHNKVIRQQLESEDYTPGDLVAGGKKDVVISNELAGTHRLGLHGLYTSSGQPIQGGALSAHPDNHVEYGMAVRLVDRRAILNGKPVDLVNDVLKNKKYAYLVSSAPLTFTSYNYDKPTSKDTNERSTPLEDLQPLSNLTKPGIIPPGYSAFKKNERVSPEVTRYAVYIKNKWINSPFGTSVPFRANGADYMARVEVHGNAPRGITVYKKSPEIIERPQQEPIQEPEQQSESTGSDIYSTIYKYYADAVKDVGGLI